MNIDLLHIGQKRSEWRGEEDGYIMEYDNISGLILYVFFKRPMPEEMEQLLTESSFKITFTDYNGVGFFCLKFGELPWGDCAFSPNLYKDTPVFAEVEDGRGYFLNVVVIDGESGTIKAIRMIELGNAFSVRFREWCIESLRQEMTRRQYEKTINECYEEYETRQLARQAMFQYELNTHREDREQGR